MSIEEPPKHILIVEDEDALAKGMQFNFEQEGYEVSVAGDGPSALASFARQPGGIDLIILDLMLPGMSGFEILAKVRELDPFVPVLILSAKRLSEDRAHAFDLGTDQYLTKPFALPELISRVRNLLRKRANKPPSSGEIVTPPEKNTVEKFRFGDVEVDFDAYEVKVGDKVHSLTTMEFQLLRYFIEHKGRVLSRSELLENVWKESAEITTRSVDNFVLRLRKIIEENSADPRYLVSVRGTGYRFIPHPDAQDQPLNHFTP
ncbi:MAG: response regulator transcription factor [Planctomycetota bacterium]|nr:response regulator transcription factor [Planctomycetota bacterium]MDA1211877.1 response regulator transcription factor [Planctomycetota bacterium]